MLQTIMEKREEYEYDKVSNEDGHQRPVFQIEEFQQSSRKFLYFAASIANLAAFVCGVTIGWTSPTIPKLKDLPENGNPLEVPLEPSQESWIGSLLPVGATIAPFLAGYLADKIGRKRTLLFGTLPFIVAFALASCATTPNLFFLVRFLFGLSSGVVFTVMPMYIGEISDDETRDTLGSFLQLFIVLGLLFAFSLGPYLTISTFNIINLFPPIIFIFLFYFLIPESPYYLIRFNKTDAEKSLMKLRAKSSSAVQDELTTIKKTVDDALSNQASFLDIFKSRGLTKAFVLSLGLIAFQQFSGINVVLFYAQDIFISAGSTIPPAISTIIIGVVQVISSGVTPILVEKKGKKYLLLLSAMGMSLALSVLTAFFWLKDTGKDTSAIAFLPVLSLILFIITYCLGFGPLPWAVVGEMFPSNVKSSASTAMAAASWFLAFLLTKYFSSLAGLIGASGSFGAFVLGCVLATAFVYKYLPDTSGKSLQEIQDLLSRRN